MVPKGSCEDGRLAFLGCHWPEWNGVSLTQGARRGEVAGPVCDPVTAGHELQREFRKSVKKRQKNVSKKNILIRFSIFKPFSDRNLF